MPHLLSPRNWGDGMGGRLLGAPRRWYAGEYQGGVQDRWGVRLDCVKICAQIAKDKARKTRWLFRAADAVANTGFGDEIARTAGLQLDLAPQLIDEDTQVVRLSLIKRAPDSVQ